jgi:hypothetical protein
MELLILLGVALFLVLVALMLVTDLIGRDKQRHESVKPLLGVVAPKNSKKEDI